MSINEELLKEIQHEIEWRDKFGLEFLSNYLNARKTHLERLIREEKKNRIKKSRKRKGVMDEALADELVLGSGTQPQVLGKQDPE